MRAHKAGSHSRQGWETFTAQAIRAVLQRKGNDQPGVVFMAWGLPAQKTFSSIGVDEVSPWGCPNFIFFFTKSSLEKTSIVEVAALSLRSVVLL